MKKLLLVQFMLLSILLKAQVKEPPPEVTLDFCRNVYIQVKIYNNDNIKASCYMAGKQLGYQFSDIEEAIENINKNKKFRDEMLKQMTSMYSDKEMITLNLISIGMKATNAKILGSYLVNKYLDVSSLNVESNSNITSNFDFLLPEPDQLLKKSYKTIIDSLIKSKIDYKIDTTFGEDIFYGYSLRTKNGEYFLTDKLEVRSYGFQVYKSIEKVKDYFEQRGAVITKKGAIYFKDEVSYYMLFYKGYRLEINKTGDTQTQIDYQKK